MAAAIFAKKAKEAGFEDVMLSDSAGTSDAHEGEPCDARAVLTCRRRDVQLAGHRARQIEASDFEKFDLILAMDWEVLTELQQRAPAAMRHKIQLLMRYANDIDEAIVPDPYYGLNEGFTRVYEYCSDACEGIIENFERRPSSSLLPVPHLLRQALRPPEGRIAKYLPITACKSQSNSVSQNKLKH